MTSVVVYKRQSNIDIIPEDDYYTELSRKEGVFNFFDLPEPVCMEVIAQLNLRDTRAVALSCRAGWNITRVQLMWQQKLWLRAKVINLALCGPNFKPNISTGMLVRDPLLVNNKLLYEILDPDSCINESQEDLDMGNLLSKMTAPKTSTPLIDMLDQLISIFSGGNQQSAVPDPFSRGEGAPTYLLFGMPETKVSKKLVLSFIASNGSTFDTVGFVKGKPGGVGGGVTVRYTHHLLNLLLVRRARPRLLVDGPTGTAFHPDVAEVIPQVDGLICYMDATCTCARGASSSGQHSLDVLELEAMLRTVPPHLTPPVLVLLARLDNPQASSADSDHDVDNYTASTSTPANHMETQPATLHRPSMLHPVLEQLDLPWAVCEVEVKTLSGVHIGLNWLLHRTLKLKNG
ncbi:hypothetical protein Pcinc_029007 [Petrolisthes cinctipes]|uniref:F-box domain-containing protein n=1 Tax=Petrolisthes cinctipes TaxID=88211 RepID=A0AAE1K4L2_PETCI|nr:hypothetical protein Pcinc_029007 [Petrolisthes cinctipes]